MPLPEITYSPMDITVLRIVALSVQIVLLTTVTCIAMGDESYIVGAENNKAYENLHISIVDNLISIQATEATLQEIFEEIARIARIQIHGAISPQRKITFSVDHRTVEEVVRQLVKNVIVVYQERSSHSSPEISGIIVLPEGTDNIFFPNETELRGTSIDSITESDQKPIDLPVSPPLPPSLPPLNTLEQLMEPKERFP